MQNLAQVILDGNLTADPEVRKTNNEKTVTHFRVAANHQWNKKNGSKSVSYFPVECWEKLAENCNQYLQKGSRVTVQGELREDRWQDKSGKNCSKLKIVARSVRFDYSGNKKKEDDHADDDIPVVANA